MVLEAELRTQQNILLKANILLPKLFSLFPSHLKKRLLWGSSEIYLKD